MGEQTESAAVQESLAMVSQDMEASFDAHRPMVASGGAGRMGAWRGLEATGVSRPSIPIPPLRPWTE